MRNPPSRFGLFCLLLIVTSALLTDVSALAEGDLHHFDLSPIASPQTRNAPVTVTVTARDINGAVKSDFTGNVSFSATSESGPVPCTPASSGAFVNGVWTGGLAFGSYANSVTLTASSGAVSGSINSFAVSRGPLHHFGWAPIEPLQAIDKVFPVTVRALDAGGNLVDDFVGPVSLWVHSEGPRPPTGIGTNSSTSGFSSAQNVARTQCIYTPEEIGGEGRLKAAEFNITTVPGTTLQNFTIRLKHTALAEYSADSGWETNDWTVVYQGALSISATGWIKIPFSTPFEYNGASNLMVDISYRNTASSLQLQRGTYQSTAVPTQRKILAEQFSSASDPLKWVGKAPSYAYSPNLPNIRFHSYLYKSVTRPGISGTFSGGVWSGNVSVPMAAGLAFLEADVAGGRSGVSNEFLVRNPLPPPGIGRIYAETFETAPLSNSWLFTGTYGFRTQIKSAPAAVGFKYLGMDTEGPFGPARNEATWTVDLEGLTGLMLKFWAKGPETSNGPPPKPFFNGADFDGVAISVDGTKWYEIQGLRPLSVNWVQYNVNLDEAVRANGLTYSSNFKIRFNRYESSIGQNAGISIDDIEISSEPRANSLRVETVGQLSEGSPAATGMVSLPIVATMDTLVALESSAPEELSVPAQIVIPAGRSTGYFPVQPLNDVLIDGDKTVSIAASSPAFPPGAARIVVVDDDTTEIGLSVSSTTIKEGGAGALATITVTSPPAAPWILKVTRSNSSAIDAPATITVPPGATTATFLLIAVNDNNVDGTQSSTVSVSTPSGASRSVTMSVEDNDTGGLQFSQSVTSVREGSGNLDFNTVLPGVLTTATTISFTSSAPSKIMPPAPISIEAGQTSRVVTFKCLNDSVADGAQEVVLTASAPGIGSTSYKVTFLDNDPHHFTIAPIASPQVRGALIPITVTARDANGAPLLGFSGPAVLNAGTLAVVPPTLIEFIDGVWSGTAQVKEYADDVVLKVNDSLGAQGTSNPFDVTIGSFSAYAWEPLAAEQRPGSAIPVTVRAVDAGGNTISSVNGPITVQALSAQPMLTIGTGETTDDLVYQNAPRARTEVLYLASELGGARKLCGISLNLSSGTGQTVKNWTIRMKQTSRDKLDPIEGWDGDGWTIVHQSNLELKSLGWTTFLFDVPFEYDGVSNLLVDFSFSNDAVINIPIKWAVDYNVIGKLRTLYSYFEIPQSPLSWSGRNPDAYGLERLPHTQFLELKPMPANIPPTLSVSAGVWNGAVSIAGLATNAFLEASDSAGRRGVSNVFNVSSPRTPANVPFFDGFETGLLSSAWTVSSVGGGNGRVDAENYPHTGTKQVIIDGSSRAELTLSLDLAGCSGGSLSFWVRRFGGADDGPPASPFTGGADFDGVAMSANGLTWYEVRPLRGMSNETWIQYVVDLDAAIAARGLAYTSNFKIRFNHYGYNKAPYDGFAIDDVTVSANATNRMQLGMAASVAENGGPITASVSFPSAVGVDRAVVLASSSPQILSVPATVTVLAGQMSASFAMTPINNSELGGTVPVTLTATSDGSPSVAATVAVLDDDIGVLTLSIPSPLSEASGLVKGTLVVSPPLSGILTVGLTASMPDLVQVPTSITIFPGQTNVPLPLRVLANSRLTGTQTVAITASVPGWAAGTANTDIQDDEIASLTLASVSVGEGSTSYARLTAGGWLSADTLVTLNSADPTRLTAPPTITIPNNASYVDVPLTAVENATKDGTLPIVISATAPGFTSAPVAISVRDNDPHHFTFQPIVTPQIRGVPFIVGISARDVNDSVMTNYVGNVSFSATSDSGDVSSTPGTGAFTASMNGTFVGNMTVNAEASNVRLTVANSSGSSGTSAPFDVSSGPPVQYTWSVIASPQTAGQPFAATITALDSAGNPTPSSGYVTISPPSDERIIGTGNAGNNLAPLRTSNHDERTQVIYRPSELGGQATLSSLSLYVTTLPGQPLTEWTIRLKHTALSGFATTSWEGSGWTTVYSANQTISQPGWVTFPFSTPFAYDGVSNLMVDFSFNNSAAGGIGAVRTFTPGGSYRMLFGLSNSSHGDPKSWSGATPAGIFADVLPQVKFNAGRGKGTASPSTVFLTNGQWTGNIFVGAAATNTFLTATDFAGGTGQSNLFSIQAILDSDADGLPDSWETANNLALNNGNADDGAFGDPDGDKVPNALEYAFNSNPHDSAQSGGVFVTEAVNPVDGKKYLEFTYRRRIATPGISYAVETSSDCVSWTSNTSFYQQIAGPLATGDGVTESITVRVLPAIDTAGNTTRFVRLRVGAL